MQKETARASSPGTHRRRARHGSFRPLPLHGTLPIRRGLKPRAGRPAPLGPGRHRGHPRPSRSSSTRWTPRASMPTSSNVPHAPSSWDGMASRRCNTKGAPNDSRKQNCFAVRRPISQLGQRDAREAAGRTLHTSLFGRRGYATVTTRSSRNSSKSFDFRSSDNHQGWTYASLAVARITWPNSVGCSASQNSVWAGSAHTLPVLGFRQVLITSLKP